MTFHSSLSFFNKSVTIFLVLLMGLIGFAGAGATNNNSRNMDARLGLLKFPAQMVQDFGNNIEKITTAIETNAQGFDINQAIQNAILAIARAAMKAFLQSLLGFFTKAFLKLIDAMEAGASKLFGLRLDFSSVRRVIISRSMKIENSINKYVDSVFPSSSTVGATIASNSSLSDGVGTYIFQKTQQDTDENRDPHNSGDGGSHTTSGASSTDTTTTTPTTTTPTTGTTTPTTGATGAVSGAIDSLADTRNSIGDLAGMKACLEEAQAKNDIQAALAQYDATAAYGVIKFACFTFLDAKNAALVALDNATSSVISNSVAKMDELKAQVPPNCPGALFLNFGKTNTKADINSDNTINTTQNPGIDNPTQPETATTSSSNNVLSAGDVTNILNGTGGFKVKFDSLAKVPTDVISPNACDATKQVNTAILTAQTPTQSTAGNETDIAGEFLKALLDVLVDFITQIINKILDIILNSIIGLLNKLTSAASGLGGNPISSAIGDAISAGASTANSEITKIIDQIKTQLDNEVKKSIKTAQATELLNKTKPEDENYTELASNPVINLNLS